MADIKIQELRKLSGFLGPRNWVLPHRELDLMFAQYRLEKYDLDPEIVSKEAGSKYDRIAKFCFNWPNLVVCNFLLELLNNLDPDDLTVDEIAELEECKEIARSLRYRGEGEGSEITLASPYFENQRELILSDLNKAKQVIWICMYLFTDYKIASKVLEKHQEGLSVELILQDNEMNKREKLQNEFWRNLRSVLWWYPKTDEGINHHKFCIIDSKRVWHGSFNFTPTAATKNQEEYTSDDNPENIGKFADEFKRIKSYIREEQKLRNQIEPDLPF